MMKTVSAIYNLERSNYQDINFFCMSKEMYDFRMKFHLLKVPFEAEHGSMEVLRLVHY